LSYAPFPLEIACNQISTTQPLPLRSVSGVIPSISKAQAGLVTGGRFAPGNVN
jgi:hypothetical protein